MWRILLYIYSRILCEGCSRTDCEKVFHHEAGKLDRVAIFTYRSMRSRWWFLALSACDDDEDFENKTSGLHVEYELFMTNGEPSEILRYQFSDDEWRK